MKSIKSIILMLISTLLFFILGLEFTAASSFPGLESQIHSGSNTQKIKKMQLVLTDFNIYTGNIDGKYDSVKDSLITYQKNTGINKDLGYFGVKTLTALKEDYSSTFDEITQTHLQYDKPATNVRYFYITAYYSPLPGQNRYTTGSYAGDIRLNGGGKRTASGKPVFTGLLAAARNYDFGTKIEFEGLGIGRVEDRGGAIVNAGERGFEYDRIDVWMGYGDEGLVRALKWGKRKVKGKIVPSSRELSIEFGSSPVTQFSKLRVDAENPKKENVLKLQNLLTSANKYSGKIDGNFNTVKNDLIKFQIESGVIKSKNDPHAGYFGEKTYVALRKMFGADIFKNRNNSLDEDVILSQKVRDNLDKIFIRISGMIDNKYGKENIRGTKYRRDLRGIIDKQTAKVKSDLRKRQLKYLKSLL